MIRQHINGLRRFKRYTNAQIVVWIEANYGGHLNADGYANIFNEFPNVRVMREDAKSKQTGYARFGVWTGPTEKQNFVNNMYYNLMNGIVRFAESMVGENTVKQKSSLLDQLGAFRRVVKKIPDPLWHDAPVCHTGKFNNKQDDRALTFMLASWWELVFRKNGNYEKLAQQRSLRQEVGNDPTHKGVNMYRVEVETHTEWVRGRRN